MMLDPALRISTAMLGAAFVQQSLEHLHPAARRHERALFAPRLGLSLLLVAAPWIGPPPGLLLLALLANHLVILPFFNGPYNGGADRMSLLILVCLAGAWWLPDRGRELAFGYLGVQLIASYAVSGWVKVVNPAWRSGHALRDVFLFSAYPVADDVRRWAGHPGLLRAAGWGVMGFELAFPFTVLSRPTLIAGLAVAALFHGANAWLFGLNRFFWIWICAYPAIVWLQDRVL
jgi:hypothetical protein